MTTSTSTSASDGNEKRTNSSHQNTNNSNRVRNSNSDRNIRKAFTNYLAIRGNITTGEEWKEEGKGGDNRLSTDSFE